MLNKVFIMGRLTRDPELKRTEGGVAVTAFSVACDRDFKDKGGNKVADFIDCVAWRNTAEFVAKHFAKGRMAVVEGRMQNREWKDKEGNNRRATEIQVDNIYFGDSKKEESKPNPVGSYYDHVSNMAGVNVPFENIEDEDGEELPF